MRKIKLAPSILSCDFTKLGEQLKQVEPYADYIEVDVIDGHFAPNISFGFPVLEAVRKSVKTEILVQLAISEPWNFIERFAASGGDILIVHAEVMRDESHFRQVIKQIQDAGVKAAVALNPQTPVSKLTPILSEIDLASFMCVPPGFGGQKFMPEVMPKIRELRGIMEREKYDFDVEVDGGVNLTTAPQAIKAGANVLVVGSALFKTPNIVETAKKYRELFGQFQK